MKRFSKFVFGLSIFLIAAFVPAVIAAAAPAHAPAIQDAAPVAPTLPELFKTLQSLGGVAVFFAALINALKYIGLLKDGSAPTASLILNLFGLIALAVLQFTGNTNLLPLIDESAGLLATVIGGVVALVYQLWATRVAHTQALAGMPVIGHSNSKRTAGESITTIDSVGIVSHTEMMG